MIFSLIIAGSQKSKNHKQRLKESVLTMVAGSLSQETKKKTKKLLMLDMKLMDLMIGGLVWMTRTEKEDFNGQATKKKSISPIGEQDNQTTMKEMKIVLTCGPGPTITLENGMTSLAARHSVSFVSLLDGHKTTVFFFFTKHCQTRK